MKIAGKILALDLSTNTGFAIGQPGGVPTFGTKVMPSTGEDVAAFAWAFDDWFSPLLSLERPELVIFEAPNLPRLTTPATLIKLYGLAYDTEKISHRFGIPARKVGATRLKKFLTGSGKASKDDMVFFARRRGWQVANDHEADAGAAWLWAVRCFAADPRHRAHAELGPLGARAVA